MDSSFITREKAEYLTTDTYRWVHVVGNTQFSSNFFHFLSELGSKVNTRASGCKEGVEHLKDNRKSTVVISYSRKCGMVAEDHQGPI